MKDKIIAKQDELILHLKRGMVYKDRFTTPEWKEELSKLERELSSLKAEAEKEGSEPKVYHSCQHPEKYRFVDKDDNLRCSDCHKVIK